MGQTFTGDTDRYHFEDLIAGWLLTAKLQQLEGLERMIDRGLIEEDDPTAVAWIEYLEMEIKREAGTFKPPPGFKPSRLD